MSSGSENHDVIGIALSIEEEREKGEKKRREKREREVTKGRSDVDGK